MTIIAICYEWIRQMKKSLIVPCNAAQGSEGSQPCLSLWLSLYLNLSFSRWWGSGGHAALMGILHISHFLFPSLLQISLLLFALSSLLCLCVHASLKPSSREALTPLGRADSHPPSHSCRLHWQSFTARAQLFTPQHAAINSGPAANNTRRFQLIFKAQPFGSHQPRDASGVHHVEVI